MKTGELGRSSESAEVSWRHGEVDDVIYVTNLHGARAGPAGVVEIRVLAVTSPAGEVSIGVSRAGQG